MEHPLALCIVVPAYDELANLRKLVPEVWAAVEQLDGVDVTLLVVLRHEAAEAEVEELSALGATPIRRSPTDSFGDAIRTGLASCPTTTDLVLFMDADRSHDPATIPRMLDAAPDADIVVASRYVAGGRSDNTLVLRTMSRTLNIAYGVVLGIRCRDISTNFKLYRYEHVRGLVLTCTNFDIVEELLFRVRQRVGRDLRIHEVPDYFHERDEGETKRALGPFVVSYIGTLVRLRLTKGGSGPTSS